MSNPVLDIGCPATCQSAGNQDLFATAYHAGIIKRLANHVEHHAAARELFDQVLTKLDAQRPITSACWQPEIGAVVQRLDEGKTQAAVVMALFALHALGVAGSWESALEEPTWGSIGGHIFYLSGHITVDATPSLVEIRSSAAQNAALAFLRTPTGWRLHSENLHPAWQYTAPAFVSFDGFADIYVHASEEPADSRGEVIVNWPIQPLPTLKREIASVGAQNIEAALTVLSKAGSHYLPWVRPLFRGVAATPLTYDDMRQSGSYTSHPGVFSCGFPGGAESIAEVIVHEVSHQNYLLLNAVFPLAQDRDGEKYYSSLKRSERPVSRVFLAYHAAANMALFWDDLSKRMDLNEYYVAEKTEMSEHATSLGEVLNNATGLTESGALLFKTQHELLQERGIVLCS